MLTTLWILALLVCSPDDGCLIVPIEPLPHIEVCRNMESHLEEKYPHAEFVCIQINDA